MKNIRPVLLIVDDNLDICEFVSFAGEVTGYESISASSGKEFKDVHSLMSPNLIVMDIAMPDIDAIALLDWLATSGNRIPIILMSGHGSYMLNWANTVGKDLNMPIIGTLKKPFKLEDLENILSKTKFELAN